MDGAVRRDLSPRLEELRDQARKELRATDGPLLGRLVLVLDALEKQPAYEHLIDDLLLFMVTLDVLREEIEQLQKKLTMANEGMQGVLESRWEVREGSKKPKMSATEMIRIAAEVLDMAFLNPGTLIGEWQVTEGWSDKQPFDFSLKLGARIERVVREDEVEALGNGRYRIRS